MKIFKNIILALWLLGMLAVYVVLLWNGFFPYNEEENRREEVAEENAKVRVKALEQMKLEAMCKDDRFNKECD